MKFNKTAFLFLVAMVPLLNSACNSTPTPTAPTEAPPVAGLTNGSTLSTVTGPNVVSFTVNGTNCSAGSYSNKPCVSVTICNPGSTTTCQTVDDILLDTGSYGLRVFKSAISSLTLTQVTAKQGGSLAECARFGDGTSEWGPVMKANVTLGGEAPVTIPIQVVDSTFSTVPTACTSPDTSPAVAGFNGILGVGLFAQDCGSGCLWSSVAHPNTGNGMYFSCSGATCTGGSTALLADQVQNPVSSLAADNNGVIIELPSISSLGATAVPGYMILGIGTRSNNTAGSITKYSADTSANMITQFNGTSYSGFLDTGSNGLFFAGGMTMCSGWFCPGAVTAFSAVNTGADHASSGTVNFQVANATSLFNSGKTAFNDLGGSASGMFDFGLPFYFGRNIYLGIDGKTSSLGTGPYWAY